MHADSIKPLSPAARQPQASAVAAAQPLGGQALNLRPSNSCTAGERAVLCRGDSALLEPVCVTVFHSLGLFLTGLLGFLFIEVLVQQQMQMSDLHPA